MVGDLGIPHKRSCSCVQRNDVRVSGCRENFVAVNRNVSLNASSVTCSSVTLSKTGNSRLLSSTGGRRGTGDLWTVLPDQITSRGVQSLNDAARIRQVTDSVINQRCRFIRPGIIHRPRPGELKLVRVLPVDLVKRAIAPCVIRASPIQPVAWRRISKRRLSDRPELPSLGEEIDSSPKCDHRHGNSDTRFHSLSLLVVCEILIRTRLLEKSQHLGLLSAFLV